MEFSGRQFFSNDNMRRPASTGGFFAHPCGYLHYIHFSEFRALANNQPADPSPVLVLFNLFHPTLLSRLGLLKPEHDGEESKETDEQQDERRYHYHWPEPGILEIPKLDLLQNSPMLDNRGQEAEDTQGDKTQSENQGGVNVFGASVISSFYQNIPEFGDAKPEPDQRQAGANPRHEGSVGSLAGALFGEFVGDIRLLRMFIHLHIFSL